MPIFPWPARGDVPPAGDPAFDALLSGHLLPEDAAEGLRPVAEAIAALNAAPATSELAAEANVLAVFRGAVGMSAKPTRSPRRRHPLLTSLLSAKLAAAAAAAAVAVGGVAAAAYAGALPASMQKLAHDTVGAPSAHPSAHPTHTATPVGPDATGHAAFGLCTAFAHLKVDGSARQKAVAFRNLATAAGGAANVTAFCAAVAHPGTTPSGQPASHPTGEPTSHPTGEPTSHPTGKPTSHPTGKPTSHPTGKPTSTP
jgi:PT repeat